MNDFNEIDRRQFARGVLVVTTSAAVLSSTLTRAADVNQSQSDVADATKPENVSRPNEQLPEELALLNVLMRRYPSDHYDRTAIRGIFSDLRGDVARGQILSQFPLMNSDEPGSIFRAYRANH